MRRKTLILCTTALTMAFASGAQAQVAETPANDPTTTEATTAQGTPAAESLDDQANDAAAEGDIVVTGFRESLASSRNVKRNAPQIVDAVVAEDIGKLPDLAVSDTAARIPGIQVVRRGGEAAQVLLRGLDEAFFNTLYNGREIFTAERRQVALQDFPSAGIAALEVFKTATANQIDPGVAGLTNVRSRRPFDFNGFELAGNVWGLHTVQAGEVTPNGNILISNRWDTGIGEIGVLLNASYTELDYLDSEPSNTDFVADPTINGQRVRFPDIQRLFYRSGNRKRPSFNGSIQWRPTDKLELYAEGLFQGFRNEIDDTLVAAPLFGGDAYSNFVFRNGTNALRSGTVVNPRARDNNPNNDPDPIEPLFSFRGGTFNKTDTYQFAAGGIYDDGPARITFDVARTDSTFTGSTESVDRIFGTTGYTVDFDNDTPQFNIRGINAADPSGYFFDGLFEEAQLSEGDDWQFRADGEYKFESDLIRSFQAGIRYTTRDAHREIGSRFAGFRGRNIPITSLPVNFEAVQPGFKGTDIQPFRTFLAPSYKSIRGNLRQLREFVIANGATSFTVDDVLPDPFRTYDATEETLAGYGQLNYDIGGVVDGTVGVRVVQTETGIVGTAFRDGLATPVAIDRRFEDVLPNASLRWKITPEVQLRLSYAQTRTRPSFEQLNPAANLGAPDASAGGLRRGNGGNPFLNPFTSDNYDVSLEYYFSRTGFASAAVFRRDLQDFVQTENVRRFDPVLGPIEVNSPVNSATGRIDGAEVQISTFFDFEGVPEFIRNFGIQANYTYLDGETDFRNAQNQLVRGRIQFVSKHTYNIVGLYEKGPLSARLTYNKRSRFLDIRRGPRGDEATGFFEEDGLPPGRLDLSLNLNPTKNFTVFFDATNLTGEPFEYRFNSARGGAPNVDYPRFLRFDEQTYSVGLRFRI